LILFIFIEYSSLKRRFYTGLGDVGALVSATSGGQPPCQECVEPQIQTIESHRFGKNWQYYMHAIPFAGGQEPGKRRE